MKFTDGKVFLRSKLTLGRYIHRQQGSYHTILGHSYPYFEDYTSGKYVVICNDGDDNNQIADGEIFHQYYSSSDIDTDDFYNAYLYPIGDNGEFSPIVISYDNEPNFTWSTRGVEIKLRGVKEPHLECEQSYINRHWSIEPIGIDGFGANVEFHFPESDLNSSGSLSDLKPIKYTQENGLELIGDDTFINGSTGLGLSNYQTINLIGLTSFGTYTADKSIEPNVTADFTHGMSDCTNHLHQFTSTGFGVMHPNCVHSWDFTEDQVVNSNEVHPYYEYDTEATYNVSHKVENTCNSETVVQAYNINLYHDNLTSTEVTNGTFTFSGVSQYNGIGLCSGEALILTFNLDLTDAFETIDRLTITMPSGLKFVSIGGLNYTSENTDIPYQPYFDGVTGLGDEVTMIVEACCALEPGGAIDFRIDYTESGASKFQEVSDAITITNTFSPIPQIDYTEAGDVITHDIAYYLDGELLAQEPSDGYLPGSTITRAIKVVNSGSAPLSNFTFIDKHDAAVEIARVYYLDNNEEVDIEQVTLAQALNDDGDDDIIDTYTFNLPDYLEVGESSGNGEQSITIYEEIYVKCGSQNQSISDLTLRWGCEQDLCETDILPVEQVIGINVTEPSLIISDDIEELTCFSNSSEAHELTIENNNVPVSNIILKIDRNNDHIGILGSAITYTHYDALGNPIGGVNPISLDAISYNPLMICDVDYNSQVIYQFNELELKTGEKIVVNWNSGSCCNDLAEEVPNNSYNLYDFTFSTSYTDLCNSEVISETNVNVAYPNVKMLLAYEGPGDMMGPWPPETIGTTGVFNYECMEVSLSPNPTNTGYLEVIIDMGTSQALEENGINRGLIFNDANFIQFESSNNQIVDALILTAWDDLGNVVSLNSNQAVKVKAKIAYDQSVFDNLVNGELKYELTAVCESSPVTRINLKVNYYPNDACACGIPLVDLTRSVQVHCPGCVDWGTVPHFTIARAANSIGEKDHNNDGIIDQTPLVSDNNWMNEIKLRRAITGDIMEGVLTTTIVQNDASPQPIEDHYFEYCYLGVKLILDDPAIPDFELDLIPVGDILLKITDNTDGGVYQMTIPEGHVQTGNTAEGYNFFLDISPSVISSYVVDVASPYLNDDFYFDVYDEIEIIMQYQIGENNIPASKIGNVKLNNHIYMGLAPLPSLDAANYPNANVTDIKYWCEQNSGNFSVASYQQQETITVSQVNIETCEKRIDNYVDFNIYTGNSKFFDYEYRNLGYLNNFEILKPIGYEYSRSEIFLTRTAGNSHVEETVTYGIDGVEPPIEIVDGRTKYIYQDLATYFTGGSMLNMPDESFRVGISTYFTTSCDHPSPDLNTDNNTGLELDLISNLEDVGAQEVYPIQENDYFVNFTTPDLELSANLAYGVDVEAVWYLEIENTANVPVNYVWLDFISQDGMITVTEVDGASYSGGNVLVENIGANQTKTIEIKAGYICPDIEAYDLNLDVNVSWSCDNTQANPECSGIDYTLNLVPEPVSLISEITNVTDLIEKDCDEIYHILYNVHPGNAGTISELNVAFNDFNNQGLILLSTDITYNDGVNNITVTGLSGNNWNIHDITEFVSAWSTGIRHNVVLEFDFEVQATPSNLNVPVNVEILATGQSQCNTLVSVENPPFVSTNINFDSDIVAPSITDFSFGVPDAFVDCNDLETTVDINISGYALGINDYLQLALPVGYTYVSGLGGTIESASNSQYNIYNIYGASAGIATISRTSSADCSANISAIIYSEQQNNCSGVSSTIFVQVGDEINTELSTIAPSLTNKTYVDICVGSEIEFSVDNLTCFTEFDWMYVIDGTEYHSASNTLTLSYDNIGTYEVSVRVKTGETCTWSNYATHSVNVVGLGVSANVTMPSCNGYNDGVIEINVSQGSENYNYSLDGAAVTNDNVFTNLNAGTYEVVVEDLDLSCNANLVVDLDEPQELLASAITNQNICFNSSSNDGEIIINAVGGTPPYTYSSDDLTYVANNEFIGLSQGNYSFFVKDANNCKVENLTATISIMPEFSVTATPLNTILCHGDQTGEIVLEVIGGSSAYPGISYEWSNGAVTQDLVDVGAGSYSVTLTDADACEASASATITEPNDLIISETHEDVSCRSGSDGSIDLTIIGNTAPYQIEWNTDGDADIEIVNVEDILNLNAGEYSVTVTDLNGCVETIEDILITQPEASLSVSESHIDPSCGSNGSISIDVTGGVAPYSYIWYNDNIQLVESTESLTGIDIGVYSVEVSDANGCTITLDNIELVVPEGALNISGIITDVICNLGSNGSIDITVTGGALPYTYQWDNDGVDDNDDSEDLDNLIAGEYSVTVTDGNGCTQIGSWVLTDPEAIVITEDNLQSPLCNSDNNGRIEISVVGGEGTYTYTWQTPDGAGIVAGQQDQTSLEDGTYNLTVTDGNGCAQTSSWMLSGPATITITEDNLQSPLCNGDDNGGIEISVAGGDGTYTYTWQTLDGAGIVVGQQDQTALEDGTYNLTVTDGNGCTQTGSWVLTDLEAIIITEDNNQSPLCNGDNNGRIEISVTGGEGTYTYAWQTSDGAGIVAGQQDQTSLEGGSYNLTVTDGNGCAQTGSWVLTDFEAIVIIEDNLQSPLCNGDNNGRIEISVAGGEGTYTYTWQTPDGAGIVAGQQDQTALEDGSYNLTVTDGNGCTQVLGPINLTDPTELVVVTNVTHVCGIGSSNGAIDVVVSGATPPYTYQWVNNSSVVSTFANVSNLSPGNYELKVIDDKGCLYEETISVKEIYLEMSTLDACERTANGEAEVTIVNGSGDYTFNWNDGQNTNPAINLEDGLYTVTVYDIQNSCQLIADATVEDSDLSVSHILSPDCYGDCSGQVEITASSNWLPLTWDIPQGTPYVTVSNLEVTLKDLCENTSTVVTIKDARGCEVSVNANMNKVLELSEHINHITCPSNTTGGNITGSIDLQIQNGYSSYDYEWSNGAYGNTNSDASIYNLPSGFYTITVIDNHGCEITETYEVEQPEDLTLTMSHTNICSTFGTASVDVSPQGTYTYLWSTDDNTSSISGIENSGDYHVTVTDVVNGCEISSTVSIDIVTKYRIHTAFTEPLACNTSTGTITVEALAGVADYNYFCSNGDESTPVSNQTWTFNNLAAGSYTVSVIDANLCMITEDVVLSGTDLDYNIDITNVQCARNAISQYSDGSLVIDNITGGTAPYLYEVHRELPPLSPVLYDSDLFNSSSYTVTDLQKSYYFITLEDINGCDKTIPFFVDQPHDLAYSFIVTDVSCNGADDGTIQYMGPGVSITGGTPPYSYGINSIGNLVPSPPGDYSGVIVDNNNCIYRWEESISEPNVLTMNVVCNSIGRDAITLTPNVSGGTQFAAPNEPYNYYWTWSNNSIQQTFTSNQEILTLYNISSISNISLTVRDANHCVVSRHIDPSRMDCRGLISSKRDAEFDNSNISNEIRIYPNPVKDVLNVDMSECSSKLESVIIYNELSQVIKVIDSKVKSIDVSDISTGVYVIKIVTSDFTEVKQFIKE
jgi:hypothetical protein